MTTSLHNSPLYGPVHSRRLGLSLGINLLPDDGKCCTFDCIYCECGFNHERLPHHSIPSREAVREALQEKLAYMATAGQLPDVLTFAGNGEPTLHPHFVDIVDDTLLLRDQYCPQAQVSILSNATQMHRPAIREALMRFDRTILKLDTVDPIYINKVDRPCSSHYQVTDIIRQMQAFKGHLFIQTLFMHGSFEGSTVSNTDEQFVGPWLEALQEIQPEGVMIYTIDRETPAPLLTKASPAELDEICRRVVNAGIPCTVSY